MRAALSSMPSTGCMAALLVFRAGDAASREARRPLDLALELVLDGPQAAVGPLLAQQLGVRAELTQPSALEHRHPIGRGDGRQAVGDDDGGAPALARPDRGTDALLG